MEGQSPHLLCAWSKLTTQMLEGSGWAMVTPHRAHQQLKLGVAEREGQLSGPNRTPIFPKSVDNLRQQFALLRLGYRGNSIPQEITKGVSVCLKGPFPLAYACGHISKPSRLLKSLSTCTCYTFQSPFMEKTFFPWFFETSLLV